MFISIVYTTNLIPKTIMKTDENVIILSLIEIIQQAGNAY